MRARGEPGRGGESCALEESRAAPAGEDSSRSKCIEYRRQLTQQAAGHSGDSLLKHFASTDNLELQVPSYIMKVFDKAEAAAYMELGSSHDELRRFTARYFGDFEQQRPLGEEQAVGHYMRLENLLATFKRRPHVMDVKVGCRSFGEEEVAKKSLRKDLYKKLIELDPSAPTEEERQAEACTKHRYMDFADVHTGLRSLCFRVDGIAHSTGKVSKSELRGMSSIGEAAKCIVAHFLPTLGEDRSRMSSWSVRRHVSQAILGELRELRRAMSASAFIRRHVMIGASVLFVADAAGPRSGVFLIDFAKSTPVPDGKTIDHQSPWRLGNHEDGLFTGVDNMMRCWEEVLLILGDTPPAPDLA